ncbi:hypothetical protein M8J76_001618 [Diaphorina citri]|nr:hypothetical protein M8J76_001618 [Diaphorina citri]
MADNEQKARQLVAEAEKKISSSSKGFFSQFTGGNKTDEAIDLYVRAGNLFKLGKKWNDGGNAFLQAGTLHLKNNNKHDAGLCFVDAANCYKKSNPAEAIKAIERAVEIHTDMGRFIMVAKHHENIAEIYEKELEDQEKAIDHYQHAADCYAGEENKSSANKCLIKIANYSALTDHLDNAIKLYEQLGKAATENSLMKYNSKEYFFKAGLCHLCIDLLNCQQALSRYIDLSPAFQDTREYKFLLKLIESLEEEDSDAFSETVKEFDSISRLDQWYTTMLLKIKRQISTNEDLR